MGAASPSHQRAVRVDTGQCIVVLSCALWNWNARSNASWRPRREIVAADDGSDERAEARINSA
jgi:hypothetical protein